MIKPGDYVYVPSHSRKALLVGADSSGVLEVCVEDKDVFVYFDNKGLPSVYHEHPIAWLATPENKTRIEEFYECVLEDPPVDEELDKFIKCLDLLIERQAKYSSLPIPSDYGD